MVCLFYLSGDEGDEGEEAGALDSRGEFALMQGADVRLPCREHTRIGIHKAFQSVHIFVIDVLHIVIAKVALFGGIHKSGILGL